MFQISEGCKSFLLISIGAILGSSMRMHLTSIFGSIFLRRDWATFVVNVSAAFSLGLLLPLQSHSGSQISLLFIFIGIGFLGSLSTFSTFICELIKNILEKSWKQFFSWSLLSLLSGILAAMAGLLLGNV